MILIGADVLEKQKEIKENAKKTKEKIERGAKPPGKQSSQRIACKEDTIGNSFCEGKRKTIMNGQYRKISL